MLGVASPKPVLMRTCPASARHAGLDEIRGHKHTLIPGRYVGTAAIDEDAVPFDERFAVLKEKLHQQFEEGVQLETEILKTLERLAHGK